MIPEGLPAEFRQEIPVEEYAPDTNKEAWYESQVMSYLGEGGGTTAPAPAVQDILIYLQEYESPLYYFYMSYLEGEEIPKIAKERLNTYGIITQ